jgi:hypothetical protein
VTPDDLGNFFLAGPQVLDQLEERLAGSVDVEHSTLISDSPATPTMSPTPTSSLLMRLNSEVHR